MVGKTSLGLVEIFSSPSISETEADIDKDVTSLRIVTPDLKGKTSQTAIHANLSQKSSKKQNEDAVINSKDIRMSRARKKDCPVSQIL